MMTVNHKKVTHNFQTDDTILEALSGRRVIKALEFWGEEVLWALSKIRSSGI
jgi:hypothetical protein